MTRFVVDASVVAKWSFPEVDSTAAIRLLEGDNELWTPDLIWSETGNIVWKKWRRNEIDEEDGQAALTAFKKYPLRIFPSGLLVDLAWGIAHGFNRSFYDSVYLALAIQKNCPMVTADRRLYNALRDAHFPFPILWVADLPIAEQP